MNLWHKAFWSALAERVVSTAAQAGLLAIGADQLNLLNLDLERLLGFMGGGALLSLLKGLAANAITKSGPSLTQSEVVVPPEIPPEPNTI
jgi:hypothetical protein